MATTGGNSSNSLPSNGHNQVTSNNTRSAPTLAISSFISKIQGALAPQKVKLVIDKRTIEKTWRNMEKGKLITDDYH